MDRHEKRVHQVRDVYVLMKKDYRISRNIRALWFFEHLNSSLKFTPQNHLVENNYELYVASVVSDDGAQFLPGKQYEIGLLPSTMVTFVAHRYRFVIMLDLSPSVSSVDTKGCCVLYELGHKALANLLRGLVLPFQLPGSNIVFTPEIHVTVVGHTPLKAYNYNQVLAQGLVVTGANVEKVIKDLGTKLTTLESCLAANFSEYLKTNICSFASSYFDVRPPPSSPVAGPQITKDPDLVNDPEAGIVNMIRCGMLALQLLPENSSSGLVVITDGCLGVPDATLFEFLLTQLRTSTISCSFLRIGEERSPFCHFGHIPHTELMQFIATATHGSYFDVCPDVTHTEPNVLNAYHKAMFLWSFQRGLEGFRFDLGDQNIMAQQASPAQLVQKLLSHPIHGKLASVMPNIRKSHAKSTLNTSLFSVMSVRLREGYTIRDIALTKGETQLEVRLVLPWREYARFEYLIRATWPQDKKRPHTYTEITLEGSYDFLHDMTCTKIKAKMSSFRSANVKKFWLALQGLSQTDQLLVHLQSFSTVPHNYTLPASVKEGVPLFYLPLPNSTTPTLNTQLNTKDHGLNQFASYWRPVVHFDIKVWQKWMHTHRIGLVLEHDIPLHKNIHIPNSSSRFSIVMFRQALTSLTHFLTEWSNFALLEGQSFIKYMYEYPEDKTKPPSWFVMVRMQPKSPCFVLRLAFIGGTPGHIRYELVKELKLKIAKLKFPQRGPKTDRQKRALAQNSLDGAVTPYKSPLRREWAEVNCCVLLLKPVDTILIRYERTPRDMSKLEDHVTQEVSQFMTPASQAKNRTAANQFNSLSRYLLHQRWVWTVQQPGVTSVSTPAIGKILSTLAKMRLQQGFHFSLSSQGIVNLMAEIDMQDVSSGLDYSKAKQRPTCVVQYILFPPHTKTAIDSLSDEEDEMEGPEEDGELQIITECWVEPQAGTCQNNPPERAHLTGLTCHQIPDTFFPSDLKCISSLITLEHLVYLCQNNVIPADLDGIVNNSPSEGPTVTQLGPMIKRVDFPFHLLTLLPYSQQAELLYSACVLDASPDVSAEDRKKANIELYNLLHEELCSNSHRNVCLSQQKSQQFLQHLADRPRSTDNNPFPFKLENFVSFSSEYESDKSTSQSSGSDFKNRNRTDQSLPRSRGNVPSTQNAMSKDDTKIVPEWRCYIKNSPSNSSTSSSLLITFIPASFEDVILLHKSVESDEIETSLENEESEGSMVEAVREKVQRHSLGGSKTEDQRVEISCSVSENAQDDKDKECNNMTSADETSNMNTENDSSEKQQKLKLVIPERTLEPKALCIPVYIYDCVTHNILSSLIHPCDFQLPSDIFQDLMFDPVSESSESEIVLTSPKNLKRVQFSADSIKDADEERTWRSSWRSQERRSTEGSNGEGGENLWQHCSLTTEMFCHCFVKGVFQSLQKGYPVCSQDVDAAINNICEESFPLEANITSFLHASCGHFQQLVHEARLDQERINDHQSVSVTEERKPTFVRFSGIQDDAGDPNEESIPSVPSTLEIPQVTLTLDPATLNLGSPCEQQDTLHQLIKDKFMDIVQKWFRPVPSSPEYFYFCQGTTQEEEDVLEDKTTSDTANAGALTSEPCAEADTNMVTTMDRLSVNARDDRISLQSNLDSEESLEDDMDLDRDVTLDDRRENIPLFLIFTCTVKSHLDSDSVPVKNITVCLSELSTILDDLKSGFQLGDLKITFDLNCLSLPGEVEEPSLRRPGMQRMFSTSSVGAHSDTSSEATETVDRSSFSHVEFNHLRNPIGHLPQQQQEAVRKCMEEIEWLLQDEIVSNLRHVYPIRSDTLAYTCKHIQTSADLGKANVSVDHVPLQFVYGLEQSAEKFAEEFQKLNLQNYQLIKEEETYYLAKKRIMYNYVNVKSLCSALDELNMWKTPVSSKVASPGSATTCKSDVETADGKGTKNISPLVLNTKDKDKVVDISAECVGRSSPLTVKSDTGSVASDSKKLNKPSIMNLEKKPSTDLMKLENISLINRRRSREMDLILKMKGSHESVCSNERRKSSEAEVDSPRSLSHEVTKEEDDFDLDKHTETPQSATSVAFSVGSNTPTSGSPSFNLDSISYSATSSGSIFTSAVQSPVSIQLTKTDGHSEPFRPSPERTVTGKLINDSFDSEDGKNETILKRCSSFAGFRSPVSCQSIKDDEALASHDVSPEKGPQIGVSAIQGRLRHCSAPLAGHATPRSRMSTLPCTPSCISSRGSFTEDPYDGDMSEMDDSATTFSESGVVRRLMPDFWLIMQIVENAVDILFQHRERGHESKEEKMELWNLLALVRRNVEDTCKKVNQQLLLADLYETRMCHSLLVDAADEDVTWKVDGAPRFRRQHKISCSENEDDDEDETFERKYLAVEMELDPGHFECECVWKTSFFIHQGLKRGTRAGSLVSIGVKILRSVLNSLSVNNRNNMFVTKEISTGNVFYLRLKEVPGTVRLAMDDPTQDLGQGTKPWETLGPGDRDGDNVSLTSSSSALSLSQSLGRTPDCVELSVYGICEAGKETKEDLVQLLKRKLDDMALDNMCEMLRRNPHCQLDKDDVQFIQKPGSKPHDSLHLTVSHKTMPHLAAAMFYLRQNLLQYLHTPKYKTSPEDFQFTDVVDGKLCAIPSDQAFLYIPPFTVRKTGMVILSVGLVDGHGHQVHLLECPRPSASAYQDIGTFEDLEAFTHVQPYEMTPKSKKPGPTALVQFHIWEVGDVGLTQLKDKLTSSLKHSLCDVAMEYYMLTAPLCTIPSHMVELFTPPPPMSAPCSPFYSMQDLECEDIREEFRERKLSMVQTSSAQSAHTTVARRSSLQTQIRFQSLRDAFSQSKRSVASPNTDRDKSFEPSGIDSGPNSRVGSPAVERHLVGSPRVEQQTMLGQYECGEMGTLHSVYADLLEHWLEFCIQLETPSVNKLSLKLDSRFSLDATLQEFQQVLARLCPAVTTRVYKMLPQEEEDEDTNIGMLYTPHRTPIVTYRRKSETALDVCGRSPVVPGADLHFMSVGRDLKQWYTFLQQGMEEEDVAELLAALVKGKHLSQRFSPHIPSRSEGKGSGLFQDTPSIIPRQKFALLNLKNKEFNLYAYNWSNEVFGSMCKQLSKLEKWTNTRTHILTNIIIQKAGLFNHFVLPNTSLNVDKLIQQTDTLDQLISNPAPPPPNKEKLGRTQSVTSLRETNLPFEVTFKDLFPCKLLHLSHLACHMDPVKQYGQQVQDIRLYWKHQCEKLDSISKLYVMWLQKTGTNFPIAECTMRTLKQASHLFHYCATPLLFSSRWRQHILEKFKVTRQDSMASVSSSCATPDSKSRSRHGSGNSMGSGRTKRTESNELRKRPSFQALRDAQEAGGWAGSPGGPEDFNGEEEWHLELRATYIYQYIKYLHTIGFQYVQMERANKKGKPVKRPNGVESSVPTASEDVEIKPSDTHNLQKTVSGGILLIEISFRNEYFCVRLYTCEHTKLGITVNQQKSEADNLSSNKDLKLLFVDECEKCKDLIHVHSFAHDFHLRCIQSYISGHQDLFKKGYYLSGLLNDFIKVYPYAPSFSRNFMQREVISIPDPSCSSSDLYDYMLKHAELHSMSVLKMVTPSELNFEQLFKNHEYALISHEAREVDQSEGNSTSHKSPQAYNIGLVILQDTPGGSSHGVGQCGERPSLSLQFFIILTSSQLMFPRQTLDRERGFFVSRNKSMNSPVVVGDLKAQLGKKSASLRSETTNYLGWSNKHQPPMYKLLIEEAKQVRSKIENMAVVSMDKCRRDTLWTKMLVNKSDDHSKKKTDADDALGKLTYTEFEEMLDRVHKIPLYEMDARLVPFQQMSSAWYQRLATVLNNRYQEDFKRDFVNPANTSEQYHLILNPKFLDLFMLLTIDPNGSKTGVYAVFRKPAKETESICPGGQNLPEQSVQSHMEQFINTCCFHLWNSML
ncbi:KICSTOR complex protein SZT2-like isoform X2 [Mya arenaria]|uniref:KICSTOR complex protein SZT2-like isoform X2 n=1 Tax=Mya arenaria TaxID=6604 RepID=UPI0022E8E546|nr:KICSTOR complex protein SZT2-like isoform X2 [Mya arenaria]